MRPVLAALLLLLRAAPSWARERYAMFEGARVHYTDVGAGSPALVFVHGWGGDARQWRAQAGAFPGARVLVLDLPGHGRSDKPKADYSLAYFARAVDAVLGDAGVEKAVLVGHSMGAPIVAKVWRLRPERIAGLVLVDGAMRPFMPKEKLERLAADLEADYRGAAGKLADAMLASIPHARLRARLRAGILATPARVGVAAMRGMEDPAAYERGPIDAPVLAVLTRSHGWPDDTETFLRALAPKLELRWWDESGHYVMVEGPEEFDRQVREFRATCAR